MIKNGFSARDKEKNHLMTLTGFRTIDGLQSVQVKKKIQFLVKIHEAN